MNGQRYDAVVVGGGIVGTSAAYALVRQGVRTLLVDRADPGRAMNRSFHVPSDHRGEFTS